MDLVQRRIATRRDNAQIKITEVWKVVQDVKHPLKIEKVVHDAKSCNTRGVTNDDLKVFGKSEILQATYLSDASKIWNKCPNELTECETLWKAKKSIKAFVTTLPV